MEGKAVLFKKFADVDAVPLCLDTQDVEEIITIVKNLEPTFAGINLEDISAPRCFEIEERLKEVMGIPVFHDDQHGTAIVVLAALINALKVVGKKPEEVRVVINGAGAAGTAILRMISAYGVRFITGVDTKGIIYDGREDLNKYKRLFVELSEAKAVAGTLADALKGADVVIGLSVAGAITSQMVASMAPDAIVFAMANPTPEILPDEAKAAGARVVATGRSDFKNQINNVLAFPGVFRGALDAGARQITEEMKLAAAQALAALISDEDLSEENILPFAFDERVVSTVAGAVEKCVKK